MSNVKLPEPNNEIYTAIRNGELVIFLGAGVSNLLGLPRWNDLAKTLLDDAINDNVLTLIDKTLILAEINSDSKKIISIIFEKFKLYEKEEIFYQHLSKHLTIDKNKLIGSPVIDLVRSIPALYITTNADNTLDDYFEKDIIYYDNNYADWRRTNPALIQIHGKVTLPSSLVFTSKQYIDRYTNEYFIDYLESVFCTGQTVLFIGYSLNEFELLERISRNLNKGQNSKIFTLQPYFSYQSALENSFNLYFKSLNITQIPYIIDIYGYSTLNLILSDWIQKFKDRSLFLITEERVSNIINEKPDIHIIGQIKNLFRNNDDLISFAIYNLQKSKYSIKWIEVFSTLNFTNIKYGLSRENTVNNPTWAFLNIASNIYEKTNSFIIRRILIKKTLALFRNSEFNKIFNNTKLLINLSNYIFDFTELYTNEDIINGFRLFLETSNDLFDIFFYRIFKKKSSISDDNMFTEIEYYSFEFILNNINKVDFENYIIKLSDAIFTKELGEFSINIANLTFETIKKIEQIKPFTFYSIGSLISINPNSHMQDENFSNEHMLIFILLKSYSSLNPQQQDEFLGNCIKEESSIFKKIALFIINKSFQKNFHYLLTDPFIKYYNTYFYSDYYLCIKNNINSIPKELVNILIASFSIEIVRNLELNEQHMIYEISKILIGFDLITEITIQSLYNSEFEFFKNPEKISQLVNFSSFSSEDIIPTINNALKDAKTLNEMSLILSNLIFQYPFDSDDYNYRFGTYIEDRIVEFDIHLDDFINFNINYKHSLVLAIITKITNFDVKLIVNIINEYVDEIILKSEYHKISNLMQKIVQKKYKPLLNNIDFINVIEKIITNTFQYFLLEFKNEYDEIYFTIHNTWIYICFNILIRHNNKKTRFVQELLQKGLNHNIKDNELTAYIFSNIYIFYSIDKIWIKSILKDLDSKSITWKHNCFSLIFNNTVEKEIFELILNYKIFNEYINTEVKDKTFDEVYRKNAINCILHFMFVSNPYITKLNNPILQDINGYNIIYVFETLKTALELNTYSELTIYNFLLDYISFLESKVSYLPRSNDIFDDFIVIITKLNKRNNIILSFFQKICAEFTDHLSIQYYEYLKLILNDHPDTVYYSLIHNSNIVPNYYINIDMVIEIIILLSKYKQTEIHKLISHYHNKGFNMIGVIKEII